MKLFYKNIFEKLLQELTTSFCVTTIRTGRRKCPRTIMFTSQHLIVYFLIFFYCLCLNSCTIWMKNLGMCVPVGALALASTRRSRKTHIAWSFEFTLQSCDAAFSSWKIIKKIVLGERLCSPCFKGTVSPVLSRLTVVLLNIVESGEVPLVI